MANKIFQDLLRARIEGAIAQSKALKGLKHKLVLGRLREILLEELLKPLAPPNFVLGSGVIMDHIGNQSGEIDIIIANRNVVPQLALNSRDGLFPLESIVYAIEVKSTLEKRHVDETIGKFRAVHALNSLPAGEISSDFLGVIANILANRNDITVSGNFFTFGPDRIRPATVLFAYSARNNVNTMLDYVDQVNKNLMAPVIQVICIPEKGYWRWVAGQGWIGETANKNRDEVLCFIAGITNTMFGSQNRFTGTKFGQYLI